MLKPYQAKIAIARHCCAIANIGASWEECWQGLLAGAQTFTHGRDILPGWPDSPPLAAILRFPGLAGQPAFSERTDRLARIVGEQMRNAVARWMQSNPDARLSLMVATSHGNPGPLSEVAEAHTSEPPAAIDNPAIWEGLVVDNLVREVNRGLGQQLPGETTSAACASSLVTLSYAADRIHAGFSDAVLVVGIDTLSRVASVGFNNIGAMSRSGCRPYDRNRDGTTVGEGAVAILLARSDLLDPADIWATIDGTAVYCDAAHMVEPNPVGVASVVDQALQQAGVAADEVAAIFWPGTGTRQNDKTEAAVSQIVFGDRSPLCTSTKGSLGHTMGASGGFNVLAACQALQEQRIPHVTGTTEPEYGNLHLALDRPQPFRPGPILVTALGFGGINAAVCIQPPEVS